MLSSRIHIVACGIVLAAALLSICGNCMSVPVTPSTATLGNETKVDSITAVTPSSAAEDKETKVDSITAVTPNSAAEDKETKVDSISAVTPSSAAEDKETKVDSITAVTPSSAAEDKETKVDSITAVTPGSVAVDKTTQIDGIITDDVNKTGEDYYVLTAVTPGSVAASGQPVLIYSDAYQAFMFVSIEKPYIRVKTHDWENLDDPRNQFILQSVGNDRYRIYNPSTGLWLFVSDDIYFGISDDEPNNVVKAHPKEAMERRIKQRNEFIFENAGNSQYLIYNPSYGEYLFVSDNISGGDNLVLSQPRLNDVRNKFTLFLLQK